MIIYLKTVKLMTGQFEQTSVYVSTVATANISVSIAHFVLIYEVASIPVFDLFKMQNQS